MCVHVDGRGVCIRGSSNGRAQVVEAAREYLDASLPHDFAARPAAHEADPCGGPGDAGCTAGDEEAVGGAAAPAW